MVQTITWKKCSLLFLVILLEKQTIAATQSLPVIRTVGVIPATYMNKPNHFEFNERKELLEGFWYQASNEAKRFRLVNHEVVAEYWDSPEGRADLHETYELDGFLSLHVHMGEDLAILSVRLLSKDLQQTYLHEVENMPIGQFYFGTDQDLYKGVKEVLFRTLNRLPIDTVVTSVNGHYITIAAGMEQNVGVGDLLKFYRVKVTGTHPATGAFLDFSKFLIGKAKVVDVKESTSVCELVSLSYEGAIAVGDGAKIPLAPHRAIFKRMEEEEAFATKESTGPILFPVQKAEGEPPVLATNQPPPPPAPNKQVESKPEPTSKSDASSDPMSDSEAVDHGFLTPVSFLDHLDLTTGPRIWSASGTQGVSANAALPLWLLNYFELEGWGHLDQDWFYSGSTFLEFGSTAKGSYFGFSLGGRFGYDLPLAGATQVEGIGNLLMGLDISYETMAVSNERYGGRDVFLFRPFLRYIDEVLIPEFDSQFKYFFEGSYVPSFVPFAFGSVGFRGSKKSFSSFEALGLAAGAVLGGKPGEFEWGGQVKFNSEIQRFGNDELNVSDFYFGLLTRYQF